MLQAHSTASAESSPLAVLRREEDHLRLRLQAVRARLQGCLALARELPELERRLEAERTKPRTAYRSDARDEERLAEARQARVERAALRIEEASLMTDLESVRARLEERGIRHVALPILESVSVASPCPMSWSDMEGDSDTRFCGKCEKHVHNLSMMSRQEAEAVITAAQGGGACVRFYRRADGTLLTDDCPVGVRRRRFWRRTKGIAAAGLLAALGADAYSQVACSAHIPASAATSGAMQ